MRRRIGRWLVRTVASLGLLVVLFYGWFRSPWGQEWARAAIIEAVEPSLVDGSVHLEAVDTNLWSAVSLQGLELHNNKGRLVRVERVAVSFAPWKLRSGLAHFRSIEVDGVTARLTTQADGRLDLAALFGPPSPDDEASEPFSGVGVDVLIDAFHFNTGTIIVDDTELSSFEFNSALAIEGSTVRLDELLLVANLESPVDRTLVIAGSIALVDGDLSLQVNSLKVGAHRFGLIGELRKAESEPILDIQLSINHIDADDIEDLAGERLLSEALQGSIAMSGGLDSLVLSGELGAASGGGSLGFGIRLNTLAEPMPWQVDLKPAGLDVHTLTPLVPEVTRLNGSLTAVGEGTEYPDGVTAKISGRLNNQVFQGHEVDDLKLEANLDQGVLSIDHLGVESNGIKADVEGVANLIESTADLRSEVLIANLRSLSALGVPASNGRVRVVAEIDADWLKMVRADLKASVDGRSIAADGVSMKRFRTAIDAAIRGDDLRGRGTVEALGLVADGASVDRVGMDFEIEQSAAGSLYLNATTSVGKVSIPEAELVLDGVDGTVELTVDDSGKAKGEGQFDISRAQYGGSYSVDGGPIRAAVDGDSVTMDVDLRRGQAPFLVGNVVGDLGSGMWSVDGFELAILESKGFVADGPLKVALTEDGARSVEARIVSPDGLGEFSISGIADADNPDLHLMARQIRLGAILELATEVLGLEGAALPAPAIGGELSMDFKIQAPPDEPVMASGWIELQSLKAKDLVDGLNVRIDTELSEKLATAEFQLTDDNGLVFWSKAHSDLKRTSDTIQPDCGGTMRWRSMLPGTRFKDLREALPALSSELNGRASADILVHGAACDPDLTAFGAVDVPVGVNGERVRVDLSAMKVGPSVDVEITADQDGRRIAKASVEALTRIGQFIGTLMAAEGAEPLPSQDEIVEHVDARLTLNNADVAQLARMAGVQHPVAGVLGGGFGVTGTLDNPVLRGGLVLVNGRLGAAELSQFTMSVEPGERGFQVEAMMGFGREGNFELSGFLPSGLTASNSDEPVGEVDLRFGGAGIPIAVGSGPSGLIEPQGTVVVEGTIVGEVDNPQVDLRLGTHDAAFTLLPTALRYEPVSLDVRVVDDAVNVMQFAVRTTQLWGLSPSSGTFDLTGTVGFEDELDIDLSSTMDGFWLSSTRSAELATSGGVEISGSYPELQIGGDLKLDDAKFVIGADMLKDTSGFEVDPMVTIHRQRRDVVERFVADSDDSDIDHMRVNLNVDLGQAVRLRADVPMSDEFGDKFSQLSTMSVDLGLDGQLQVNQSDGVLSVVGELETLRGEATAMGKRFGIREGTVTFTGENFANPQLNLDASHRVGQYGSVDIAIGGDVEHTSMDLTSPEYPDQTDVMSMLLFGKPTSAMSETEGESGAGLLSAAMASAGGKAAKATGAAFLQNVQIDPGSGSVKVGFPLTDKVYLSIEKVKSDSDSDNMTQAAVEWILSRSTYGELVTGDRGQSSGDLYWRWRF